MVRFCRSVVLVSIILGALWSPSVAQSGTALLLYKSSEEGVSASRVATNVEPILKSLGWKTTYHDVDKGLPTGSADLIVSWYASAKIADPESYIDWMANQISAGRKVVILGNFGAHTADGSTWMTNESLNRFFYPFGLRYGAAYTGDTSLLRVTKEQAPAAAPSPLNYYLLFTSENTQNQVFLEVERSDLSNSKSALVVQTPYGGMAQETYVDKLDLAAFLTGIVKAQKKIASRDKKLLGLYKSSEGVDARTNFLARFVAPTLYDLGYGIDYHDIDSGLPSADRMGAYTGVISWYTTPELAKAADYIDWLATQIDAGRRVIILGNFGAFAEDISSSAGDVRRYLQSPEYNRFFFPFGLEFRGAWTPEKKSVKVAKKDPSMMTWLEPGHVGHYYWIRSVHPDNQEFLTVTREDLQEGESAVVVSTPNGGLALESYVLSTDPATQQPRMHLDMKKFLSTSLTLQGRVAEMKPALDELQAKPPLPPLPRVVPEGDGKFPSDVKPFKRRILAFYQSSVGETPGKNQTFLSAQTMLEHLGLTVEFHDLDSPNLPTMETMESYRGIVLWISSSAVKDARTFNDWLIANVVAGRKLVLLGDYQIRDKDTLSLINPQGLYAALGLHYDPLGNAPLLTSVKGMSNTRRVAPRNPQVVKQNPEFLGFERELQWEDEDLKSNWHLLHSLWPDTEVALTVKQAQGVSDVIIVSRTGGAAVGPFPIYNKGNEREKLVESADPEHKHTARAQEVGGQPWRLDPFVFFARALGIENSPKVDVTTLNGSRIYYSHIDGDAFGGLSLIDRSSLNGEMMYKRMLRDLPLPVTVSFVTKDIESRLNERYSRELDVAQEILRLPNIEAASHTYSHPFDWRKGDLTLAGDPNDPFKLARKPVDLQQELKRSVGFVDKLCPPDKRCEILLWSGRCNPTPEALEYIRKDVGIINMNGAEPTYDSNFPHLAGLLPLYRDADHETQFHVSAAGDFYFTKSWTADYDGMKNLPDYWNRTESPRRLRCLNVYYHFYLAERQLGIDGLHVAYDDVLRRTPAPMFASEYANLLEDALETKIGTDSEGRAWMKNKGLAATMRFDRDSRYPDLAKSRGVIGFNRANGDLYVHLDGSGEARVALSEQPPQQPYLDQFTHPVTGWQASKELVEIQTRGQGPVYLSIKNLAPSSTYRIETDSEQSVVKADDQGKIEWRGRFDGYRKSQIVRIRKANQ